MNRKKHNKTKTQLGNSGFVRIIGGSHRGRKLPVLVRDGLRPTSDRVRETLFNWLQFDIVGAKCLDAFSGSGALGFEALSRGAESVVFLEKMPDVAEQIKRNLKLLQIENAQVICTDSISWLENYQGLGFDGVFLDPPFSKALMAPTLKALLTNPVLKMTPPQFLYVEQEKSLNWSEHLENWSLHRQKTTSQTRFSLWRIEA